MGLGRAGGSFSLGSAIYTMCTYTDIIIKAAMQYLAHCRYLVDVLTNIP